VQYSTAQRSTAQYSAVRYVTFYDCIPLHESDVRRGALARDETVLR
jgi:hypothetical protein